MQEWILRYLVVSVFSVSLHSSLDGIPGGSNLGNVAYAGSNALWSAVTWIDGCLQGKARDGIFTSLPKRMLGIPDIVVEERSETLLTGNYDSSLEKRP